MTPKQRGELVEKEKACWNCLDWCHGGIVCKTWTKYKCQVQVGSNPCNWVHHRLLHDSGVAYCHLAKSKFGDSHALFEIQYISPESTNTTARVLPSSLTPTLSNRASQASPYPTGSLLPGTSPRSEIRPLTSSRSKTMMVWITSWRLWA